MGYVIDHASAEATVEDEDLGLAGDVGEQATEFVIRDNVKFLALVVFIGVVRADSRVCGVVSLVAIGVRH